MSQLPEPPESTVARLRHEAAQLRRELHDQRLVGPAVGLLAGRLGCEPGQARERLAELARAYGVPLIEAAGAVLAVPARPVPDAPPDTKTIAILETARLLTRSAWRTSAPAPDEDGFDALAAVLCDRLTRELGPVAVGLLALEPDGSLRLAGSAGIPAATVAAWRRVPAQFNTAVIHAVRSGRARWHPRLDETRRRHVLIGEPEVAWPSRAALPLREASRIVGVVGVYCRTPNAFDPATRRAVARRVNDCVPRFAELLRLHPDQAAWVTEVQAVLDMLPGAVALHVPLRDADGRIVDYRLAAASPGAVDVVGRRGRELVGLQMLEAYPSLAGGELMQAYAQVLATGQGREIGPLTYETEQDGVLTEALYSVRAHRLGDGLLVSWERHDEEQRYAARLARTERLGNLGWVEWDLTTDTAYWSGQVYQILDRDPAAGPARLDGIAAHVVAEDMPVLEAALGALLEGNRPLDVTYRLRVPDGMRHVRAFIEGAYDVKGRLVRASGIVQDVSAMAAADRDRRRLADIERQLADRQRTLQNEHRVVAALQEIILPLPVTPIEMPGLQVGVRYQPAEELARVGGDWYDIVALPGGRTLLAVGDVAGHGITAAATMARLRHALTALALITNDPAELLEYLNRMVCDDPAEPTATVVVARYDPHTATLTWAQAGHPPPVLIAGGAAKPIDRPAGMLVGARRDATYGKAELRLPADSRLLLFTDGLIERRGDYEGDWLDPLLATVAGGDRESVDSLLRRLQPANPDDDTCVLVLRPLPG